MLDQDLINKLDEVMLGVQASEEASAILILDKGDGMAGFTASASSQDQVFTMLLGALSSVVERSGNDLNRDMIIYTIMAMLDVPLSDEFVAKGHSVMLSILQEYEDIQPKQENDPVQ